MAGAWAWRGRRSPNRRVSSRNTSSRVRSGNMLLAPILRPRGLETTKGRDRVPPLACVGSKRDRFGSRALIRRFGCETRRRLLWKLRLFGRVLNGCDRYESAAGARAESDAAVDERKEGMVLAHADVHARMPFGAALTHDDVAGEHAFVAELLHAETAATRIAPVARGTACFLVSHGDVSRMTGLCGRRRGLVYADAGADSFMRTPARTRRARTVRPR